MNNKLPKISFVFDRRKTATSERKAPVELFVTHNYQQKYISTGIMLYPNQWRKGKIVNCPDVIQISQILDKLLTDVRQVILDMMQEGNIDIHAIPNKLLKKSEDKTSFLDYCHSRLEIRKYGKSKGTGKRYDCFYKEFKSWNIIVAFDDITDSNIIAFDRHLAAKSMTSNSRWSNYHKFLNSIINDAIKEGFLFRNPYKWLSIERDHSNGVCKHLSPAEFRKLKCTPMPTETLSKARDVFIFQTYTCLSYADLKAFDARQVQELKGTKVYIGNRNKTYKPFTIPILTPAWEILMKYKGKLPITSCETYNAYLKIIAQASGIDKPISSHWARHTGATLLLNEGVDLKIVSKICGHSSTRITEQVYAKLLDETVVDAVTGIDI